MRVGFARVVVRGPIERSIVELQGELDFTCAPQVVSAIEQLPAVPSVIDLSRLEFVDSAGVQALDSIASHCVENGHCESVPMIGATAGVRRTIELVRERSASAVL